MRMHVAALAALLSMFAAGPAAAQVAENGSCNGRTNSNTFTSRSSVAIQGGSHLAGEVTTFSVSSMIPTDVTRTSGTTAMYDLTPMRKGLFSLSISVTGPGVNLGVCEGLSCNGASFTAPADGNFQFSVAVGLGEEGGSVTVSSQCTPLSTGPDEDLGAEAQSEPTQTDDREQRAIQTSSNVTGVQNNISAGRMPIMPNTSPVKPNSIRVFFGQQGIELGLSNSGRKSHLASGHGDTGLTVFTNVRFTQLTGTDSTDIEGPILEGRLGAKQELGGGLAVGAYLSLLTADIESTPLATEVEENRFGGAIFLQMQLDDGLSAALTGFYEVGSADITSQGATGSADTAGSR